MNKKRKKIVFITLLTAFLIFLTPCVSAINVNLTENKDVEKKIEHVSEKTVEKIDSEVLIDLEKELKNQINIFEKSDFDWKELPARIAFFILWAAYIASFILGLPIILLTVLIFSVFMSAVGFILGIVQGTGDPIERAVAGLLLGFLTILQPGILMFHLWADGFIIPENNGVPLIELYNNLIDMFYAD